MNMIKMPILGNVTCCEDKYLLFSCFNEVENLNKISSETPQKNE